VASDNNISKYLSYILRHAPESIGLSMDNHGWVDIDELIEKAEYPLDKDLIQHIVATSDKQRFSINNGKIRANQGHSIEVNIDFKIQKPPQVLYHGTANKFMNSIKEKGLLSQQRQYVHLTDNISTAREVGARYGKSIVLEIEANRMHEDRYKFYLSENNVWLTYKVPTQYIKYFTHPPSSHISRDCERTLTRPISPDMGCIPQPKRKTR